MTLVLATLGFCVSSPSPQIQAAPPHPHSVTHLPVWLPANAVCPRLAARRLALLDSSSPFSPLQWTGQKKLVLNTGVHHATIERKGTTWHLYVMSERRVTISRDVSLDISALENP